MSNITLSRSRYFWNYLVAFIGGFATSNLYRDVRNGWPAGRDGLTLTLGLFLLALLLFLVMGHRWSREPHN